MPRKRTGVWLIRKGKRALKCLGIADATRAAGPGDTIQVYESMRTVYAPRISIRGVLQKGAKT